MRNEYLEAGRFCSTHGIRGDLRAECWCDSLEVLTGLRRLYLRTSDGMKALDVRKCVPFKDLVLINIEGYDTPEEASVLKNKVFFAKREDLPLPEGSFFIADLLGAKVFDADTGLEYGVLSDVTDGAASQLYEVKMPNGKTALVPVVPQILVRIDPDEGIAVRPVKGLFDEI